VHFCKACQSVCVYICTRAISSFRAKMPFVCNRIIMDKLIYVKYEILGKLTYSFFIWVSHSRDTDTHCKYTRKRTPVTTF
jgi:hypothetical protein